MEVKDTRPIFTTLRIATEWAQDGCGTFWAVKVQRSSWSVMFLRSVSVVWIPQSEFYSTEPMMYTAESIYTHFTSIYVFR